MCRLVGPGLQPAATAVTVFGANPVTQDEAASWSRAGLNLFGKWDLNHEQPRAQC